MVCRERPIREMWVVRIGLFRFGRMALGLSNIAQMLPRRCFARRIRQRGCARRTVAFRPGGNWSMTSSLTGVSPTVSPKCQRLTLSAMNSPA